MRRKNDNEIVVKRIEVTEKGIKLYDKRNNEIVIDYSSIYKIGVEKRFNKVLALLTIVMSIILLVTMNGVYLVSTLILFIVTLISREEILLISYDIGVLRVRGLRRAELNAVINNFKNRSTR